MIFSNNKLRRNKKGIFQAVTVILIFLLFLFILAVFFVVFSPLQGRIYDRIDTKITSSTGQAILDRAVARNDGWLDGVFVMAFACIWIATIFVAYYSEDIGPWIAILFILFLFVLLIAGNISDYWKEFTDEASSIEARTTFPGTYWFMDNLIWGVLIIVGSGVVIRVVRE